MSNYTEMYNIDRQLNIVYKQFLLWAQVLKIHTESNEKRLKGYGSFR